MLPERKSTVVTRLRKKGRIVFMAGDGISEAPALTAANIRTAVGAGVDVATENVEVTQLGGDLQGIARPWRLSQALMRNVRQNLTFAFIYNAGGVPVVAGCSTRSSGCCSRPTAAAPASAQSSVSVIGNSLRMRSINIA